MMRSVGTLGLAALLLPGLGSCQALRPFDTKSEPGNFSYDPRFPIQRLTVENFESYAAAQEEPVWCWAACAAMVSDYYANEGRSRVPVDQKVAAQKQDEIVRRILERADGSPKSEEAASESEVLGALNVDLYEQLLATEERVEGAVTAAFIAALLEGDDTGDDEDGGYGEAGEEPGSSLDGASDEPTDPEPESPSLGFDATRLYHDLKGEDGIGGHPVIAALRGEDATGHVVVITGAHCQEVPVPAPAGQAAQGGMEYRIMAVRIWDPTRDPEGASLRFGGEYWLAGAEFASHCDFMASRSSAKEYLDFLVDHAEWAERAFTQQEATP
jgi:hypothetical protein